MDCYCNDANSRNDCSQNRRARTCRQAMMQNRQPVMGSLNRSYRNSAAAERTSNCSSVQASPCCKSEKTNCESQPKTNCGWQQTVSPAPCGCTGSVSGASDHCSSCCSSACQKCSSSECLRMANALRASKERPVGMTYTPFQEFTCPYDWEKAFCQGTIFADLDKPFLKTNCRQGGVRI